MDAIRKRLAPKKEVPRKIEISYPRVIYAEPERPEDDEDWKSDPFGIPPHPSYAERTDHPSRPEFTKKKIWREALENKNFPIVPPSDPTTTFQHNFTTLEHFEFRPEKEPPRRAPTYEQQLKRYPPTHHSDGTPILPPPAPSGYVPYDIQQTLKRKAVTDRIKAQKRADRRIVQEYREQKAEEREVRGLERAYEKLVLKDQIRIQEEERRKEEAEERLYGPIPPPTPPPKDPPKARKATDQPVAAEQEDRPKPAKPPRLADVLQKPDYDSLSPEQKKDLLPPPVQHTGRHAQLRDNLAKAKAAKAALNGHQPLEGSFASNSVSTPAPDPSFWVGNEEAIYRPGKPTTRTPLRSASVSHKSPVHDRPGTPTLSSFKFGSSWPRRVDENSFSTPAVDHSSHSSPRQSRTEGATHTRNPSRNAVYYTPEDLKNAAFMGSSSTRPRTESTSSRMEPTPQPQPQLSHEDPAPVASGSHVRSDSTSSTKRHGTFGWPPTPPLRIHKRDPSTSSDSPSHSHTVLDYAMATTSRAGSRNEGPPPVMRHRDLIDASRPPVIKRPGRLDSLPISARSKNAKEEYFTPPPARVFVDPIDGTRTPVDEEFGGLPRRNHSTSSATAPSRLRSSSSSHGHSQSLQLNPERGLPAHPAVHLQERKIRRVQLQN